MKHNHYTLGFYPLNSNGYTRFSWPWWKEYLNPNNYWKTVKYFCQRGYRGYADCDAWDMDSYMDSNILGLLKELQEHKHGFPAELSNYNHDLAWDAVENLNVIDTGAEEWATILQEMIDGFEASIELRKEETVPEGTYSNEPVEFEDLGNGMCRLKETDTPRFNNDLYNEWSKPLVEKQQKARELLIKWWPSLWD